MSNSAIDRRRALLGGAAAGTALWVAPQLSSAAAAQTCSTSGCAPEPVNLLTGTLGAGTILEAGAGPFRKNGTFLTATRSNSTLVNNGFPTAQGGVAVPTRTGVIRDGFVGNIQGGHIPLCALTNSSPKIPTTFTLNFNPGVRKLSFVITDIDAFRNAQAVYQEQVTIGWTTAYTAAPTYQHAPVGTPLNNIPYYGGLSPVPSEPTNTYKAPYSPRNSPANDGNVPLESTTGNLIVTFNDCGPITQLVVTTSDLLTETGNDGTQGRLVSLTNFSWCQPLGRSGD